MFESRRWHAGLAWPHLVREACFASKSTWLQSFRFSKTQLKKRRVLKNWSFLAQHLFNWKKNRSVSLFKISQLKKEGEAIKQFEIKSIQEHASSSSREKRPGIFTGHKVVSACLPASGSCSRHIHTKACTRITCLYTATTVKTWKFRQKNIMPFFLTKWNII